MRKRLILIAAVTVLILTGCKAGGTDVSETVNTVNIIKTDASYGEDMVTFVGYDMEKGYSRLEFYNPKTDAVVEACGLANCSHEYVSGDAITCNALFEGSVNYPFIYEDKLYYIYENETADLYESNVDGSDKKKISALDFSTDMQDALFKNGKLYITSYSSESGEEDEDGVAMPLSVSSELYEIDIKTGEQRKLTDFGKKANILCFVKVSDENKIYLGVVYDNKNIYDSELKSWNKYMSWLGSGKNTYKEGIDIFDKHSEYYCLDLESNKIEKLEFNYDMTYEGMEDVKGYYDFRLIGANDECCYYYTTVYGDQCTLYEYDRKNDTYQEIEHAYRMTYAYNNGKIFVEKTQYDEDKQIGAGDSEDKNIPPEYRCYDTKKHEWTEIAFDCDMNQKQLLIEAASDQYVFGYLCDFTDDDSENEASGMMMAPGEMIGLAIK